MATSASIDDGQAAPADRAAEAPASYPAMPLAATAAIVLGTVFALLYAAGTAALANVVHWISRANDGENGPMGVSRMLLLGLLVLRPAFFVAHVRWVSDGIGRIAAASACAGRELSRAAANRRLIALIILTRDVPMILVLITTMLIQAGPIGGALASFVLAGLLLARAAWPFGAASPGDLGYPPPAALAIARRRARALSQAAADVPIVVLVVCLVISHEVITSLSAKHLTTATLSALLLGPPVRRISRLLARRHKASADDGALDDP